MFGTWLIANSLDLRVVSSLPYSCLGLKYLLHSTSNFPGKGSPPCVHQRIMSFLPFPPMELALNPKMDMWPIPHLLSSYLSSCQVVSPVTRKRQALRTIRAILSRSLCIIKSFRSFLTLDLQLTESSNLFQASFPQSQHCLAPSRPPTLLKRPLKRF